VTSGFAEPGDLGMRVVFLGTAGGPNPTPGRRGIATALIVDGDIFLIDAGRGVLDRYLEAGLGLEHFRAILITHMHGDHISDLFSFLMYGVGTAHGELPSGTAPLDVIGPGPVHAAVNGSDPFRGPPYPGVGGYLDYSYAGSALTLNSWSIGMPDLRALVRLHEIEFLPGTSRPTGSFEVFKNDGVTITATIVPHLEVSFAYRLDAIHGSVVFSGDTGPSPAVADLVRGAGLLVHEVMDLKALLRAGFPETHAPFFRQIHTDIDDVGPIVRQAGVTTLAVNHLLPPKPTTPKATWIQRIGDTFAGEPIIAEDLMSVAIGKT
jgi:ribonuclease BN (tRNA processing enzyme)